MEFYIGAIKKNRILLYHIITARSFFLRKTQTLLSDLLDSLQLDRNKLLASVAGFQTKHIPLTNCGLAIDWRR